MSGESDGADGGESLSAAFQRAWRRFDMSPEALLNDPAWFPYQLDLVAGEAIFTRTGRAEVAAQTFLDPRWSRVDAAAAGLPLERLAEAPPVARSPVFVWHSAFCCSTLIANCLDRPGKVLALKEPRVLVDLADAEAAAPVDPAMAMGLVRLLARGFEPNERVVIKPSNAANTAMGLIAPESSLEPGAAVGPMLLLHSKLKWFLLSVARGGEVRRAWVRPLLARRLKAAYATRAGADPALVTDLMAAALLWRLQMADFEAAAEVLGPERVWLLDCEAFLAAPQATLRGIDSFLGLGLGEDHIAETVRGPRFLRHAKNPRLAFDLELHRRSLAEVEQGLGEDLEHIIAWSAHAMDRLSAAA